MAILTNDLESESRDNESISRVLTEMAAESDNRISSVDFEQLIRRRFKVPRKTAREWLRAVVESGDLVYTYEHGHSFIEKSFDKLLRISSRVVLKPPGVSYDCKANEVILTLNQGASFGGGNHPTTRLAVNGIDHVLDPAANVLIGEYTTCLDIGTGSGVLALAALKLGVGRAVGLDIDPVARYEAEQNAIANHLGHRLKISDRPLDELEGGFDLILANLRYPTLCNLVPSICAKLKPAGKMVVSGLMTDEAQDLIREYQAAGLVRTWLQTQNRWAALVFDWEPPPLLRKDL